MADAVKMKVKKGDTIEVITGKDLGRRGTVLEARPTERRLIVEHLNIAKRHSRRVPCAAPAARSTRPVACSIWSSRSASTTWRWSARL